MKIILKNEYAFFLCPGCGFKHGIPVTVGTPHPKAWMWNGNIDSPTFVPSIRVTGVLPDETLSEPVPFTCHSFVEDGKIRFCSDSTHALAGQTVDLTEVSEESK